MRDYLETLDWDKTAPGPQLPRGRDRAHAREVLRSAAAAHGQHRARERPRTRSPGDRPPLDMELDPQHLENWLWPSAGSTARRAPRLLVVARYAFALLRDFLDGELSLRAMSLVYTTMLAIVPLLAFSFSVLKGLGFHRRA